MEDVLVSHRFNDRDFYSAHFMDLAFWELPVKAVCMEHGFVLHQVEPGIPGTFPTFIVTLKTGHLERVVVKFFGALFIGAKSFSIERALGRWLDHQGLPIRSPAILAEGQISSEWAYLILEYIPAMSIGAQREHVTATAWHEVAKELGSYLYKLHTAETNLLEQHPSAFEASWDGYARFLVDQRRSCQSHHRTWNDLPAHLVDQLDDFILPVDELIDCSSPPHVIHADLTADHLLGNFQENHWRSLAIIDWGDAMIGNILYELVALYLDMFQADRNLLRIFLKAYHLPRFFQPNFPKKALSMVLLHQFPQPTRVYSSHQEVKSLDELAHRLFGDYPA